MVILSAITDVEKIFLNYGWPGLIAIGAITIGAFVFKHLINKSSKSTTQSLEGSMLTMTKELTTAIKEQNKSLLDAFIIQSNSNNTALREVMLEVLNTKSINDGIIHSENIQRRMDVSTYVKQRVHDLFKEYSCDRAFILEFHNSKQNLTGLSFVWYDMIYEDVARGYYTLQNTYKDQEASQLLPIINKVNNGNGFAHYTIDELEELQNNSTALYHRLRIERQLQECVILGLYAADNTMIGLLVLEYEDSFLPIEVFDVDKLISEASAISSLLDCSNHSHRTQQ